MIDPLCVMHIIALVQRACRETKTKKRQKLDELHTMGMPNPMISWYLVIAMISHIRYKVDAR